MKAMLEEFKFLIHEYGFDLIEKKDDFWFLKLVYLNSMIGVIVSDERKEQYVDIDICKLVDKKIIDNTTQALKTDTPLNCINLNSIIKVTNPEDSIMPAHHYDESSGFFASGGDLKYYHLVAEKLRKYSSSFLLGDLSGFEDLATKVKKFYQKNIADYENSKT
jgi:hypothetical protein